MSQVAKVQTYGRITKVNKSTGIVEGIAMDETPDRDREIFDYDSSKKYIEQWSNTQADATKAAGQEVSYGNIRGQHDAKIAAGRIAEPIAFDDKAKSVTIKAKVVDPDELEKCYQGVYTGFSVKGPVVGQKWRDGAYTRYTVQPIEVSLVDIPCNPGATFTAVKADGSEEVREFVHKAEECAEVQGVRRYVGETTQEYVERAVSTLVSKSAEKPITQEKTMTPEEIQKASAADKVKAAKKAFNSMGACISGYCDHTNPEDCASTIAKASGPIADAFKDDASKSATVKKDDDVEAAAKAKKEEEEKAAKEKKDKEEADKAAGSNAEVADLKKQIADLTAAVEKMASGQPSPRNRPLLNGTVVERDVTKGAKGEEPAIDPNDPQRVEKSMSRIFKGELEQVTL